MPSLHDQGGDQAGDLHDQDCRSNRKRAPSTGRDELPIRKAEPEAIAERFGQPEPPRVPDARRSNGCHSANPGQVGDELRFFDCVPRCQPRAPDREVIAREPRRRSDWIGSEEHRVFAEEDGPIGRRAARRVLDRARRGIKIGGLEGGDQGIGPAGIDEAGILREGDDRRLGMIEAEPSESRDIVADRADHPLDVWNRRVRIDPIGRRGDDQFDIRLSSDRRNRPGHGLGRIAGGDDDGESRPAHSTRSRLRPGPIR
jgi:hypothetical protein